MAENSAWPEQNRGSGPIEHGRILFLQLEPVHRNLLRGHQSHACVVDTVLGLLRNTEHRVAVHRIVSNC